MWRDTLADSPTIEADSLRGGSTISTKPNQKMIYDIQVAVSRLVTKAPQLIENETTNMAESWMHVRCKFDGGKVINRIQKGSFEHRCHGAGLQHNAGKEWGPKMWNKMTSSPPNNIFVTTAQNAARKATKDHKRKSTDSVKEKRRKVKYAGKNNSLAARKAYSRHDDEVEPNDVTNDVSPEVLAETKRNYYETKVVVTKEEAEEIELGTREQASNEQWKTQRRKRLTASRVGGILKMRKTHNPWLAATPDGIVVDPSEKTSQQGLLEIKNPHSKRNMTLKEACISGATFCLKEDNKENVTTYSLKRKHDYFFQVQCQMFCVDKEWCDIVVRMEKDMHIERFYRDKEWWDHQLPKMKAFYSNALLPELACLRFGKGNIREPPSSPS